MVLKLLNISNYALIEKLEIEFSEGLNILTGETGAGKSIIVGAISLLMGARSQADFIRDKDEKAWVEACFDIDIESDQELACELRAAGIPLDEDYLIIRREISPTGKSLARINGVLVQIGLLKQISSRFLNIYGQHDFQILSDPANHLDILDRANWTELSPLREEIKDAYAVFKEEEKKVKSLQEKIASESLKKDYLDFQLEEFKKIGLENPDEDEQIDQELKILENQEKIVNLIDSASQELYGQDSAYEKTGNALNALTGLLEYLNAAQELKERLASIYYELEDLVLELKNQMPDGDYNPERLDWLNQRKFALQGLKKKYNLTLPALIEKKKELEEEKDLLENTDIYLEKAEKEKAEAFLRYESQAIDLSKIRHEAASHLEKGIKRELSWLGMPNVDFKVAFEETAPGPLGLDKLEFLISANLGEEAKPIAKIASGGEMSRIMLSLKVIISSDGISTMIFDEVDSGIGGETIVKVGQKLLEVSEKKQVLCVTHSPQLASLAQSHYFISKSESENRTVTTVKNLNQEERVEELSRMLGDKSQAGRQFARQMLKF